MSDFTYNSAFKDGMNYQKNKPYPEYVSFSACLPNGKEVRITVPLETLEIVSRDNEQSFSVKKYLPKLTAIEFEDIYDS